MGGSPRPEREAESPSGAPAHPAGDTVPESDSPPRTRSRVSLPVVGIGASAGGLQALEQLFTNLPADTGGAFVVVQHLSPDFKSLMDELLAKHTSMRIKVVHEDQRLEADHIYLIPPRCDLKLDGDHVRVTRQDREAVPAAPIDVFLSSLAEDRGNEAVAVILSGTGSDGSRGAAQVKESGGVVLVQEPSTAAFNGMPHSAIDATEVDAVLEPGELAVRLARYLHEPERRLLRGEKQPIGEDMAPLDAILDVLRASYGIDFHLYKPNTLLRRIERRMSMHACGTLAEYSKKLLESEQEQKMLYGDLLIRVTEFFRDPESYQALLTEALPDLVAEKQRQDEELRIWVAGCASGEEPISLAILLDEYRRTLDQPFEYRIFATDIDPETVSQAGLGHFPAEIAASMGEERLDAYFEATDHGYQLVPAMRDRIVFAQHDLVRDPPFTRMDLISCRNVLIYFRADLQNRVLGLLDFALNPNGVLFLGPSETIGELSTHFGALSSRWKIFRKSAQAGRKITSEVLRRGMSASSSSTAGVGSRRAAVVPPAERVDYSAVATAIANEYLLVCLVLDGNFHVRYVLGDPAGLLRIPLGMTTYDVFRMLDGDLRLAVGTALHRTEKTGEDSVCRRVQVTGLDELVDVKVKALDTRSNGSGAYALMVQRSRLPEKVVPEDEVTFEVDERARERIDQLEHELSSTKEHLQATVEELETANEELQAANEELLASNEELQSTNEELHSVNEELYTVNAEHQSKIRELTVLNADIENLFQNLDIGIVFLDPELRVRKYTQRATEIIKLIPQDVGRPLEHLNQNVLDVDLVDTTRAVLTRGEIREQRVQTANGSWLFVRVLPYRDGYGETRGALLTLVDITDVIEGERTRNRLEEEFRQFAEHITDVFWLTDATGEHVLYVNPNYELYWGKAPDHELGRDILFDGLHPEDQSKVRAVLESPQWAAFDLEYRVQLDDGSERWLHNRAFPVTDRQGDVARVAGVISDITQRKQDEISLRRLASIVESSKDGLFNLDSQGVIRTWNPGAQDVFGVEAEQVVGQPLTSLYPDESESEFEALFERLRQGESVVDYQSARHTPGKDLRHVELTVSVIRGNGAGGGGFAVVARDVTERLARETELHKLTQSLERQANHDPLTGLLNRRGLEKFLFVELERTRREGQRVGAVLIDCDNFKRINDQLGHSVGDVVLQSIAKRLRAALRPSDFLGRIGGDEFMVLLPNTRLAEALQLAERLRLVVAESPLQLQEQMIGITASLGVTLVPENVISIEEIVSHSQHALSQSKSAGKNRVSLREGDDDAQREEISDATRDVGDLVQALTSESAFRTVVQPIFDLVSERAVAYELLSRGPEGAFESPDDFFRISAENNILTTVDLLCAKRAMDWVSKHANGVRYHVNLFPSTLLETPAERLEQMFEVLGDPSRFCVEISEQQFVGDAHYLLEKVRRLREFGVSVALDDVGFGRSSLESLILLEPDIIKIDQSFVRGAHADPGQQRSLQRLVMLSKNLDTTLVAEGIEEHRDIDVLVDMGVRMGQGFLWGEPRAN